MTTERRFEALWLTYLARVVTPSGAGQIQIQETRRAFYAGGVALFGAIINMLSPGSEPTDEDLRKMNDIQNEFSAYLVAVAEGKA